jgi:outer membrane protein insertion porin family
MFRWIPLLFVLFSFTLFGQANLESLRVGDIEICPQNLPEGMSFNTRAVRNRLRTKVGNYFSQNEFDQDLKMLAEEYDQVQPEICLQNQKINIQLCVWLKPTIRTLTFCGNERVSTSSILKEIEVREGDTFDREKFVEAFQEIRRLYIKKGYFEAELDYELIPVGNGDQIDAVINICEGRAGKIYDIQFCGICKKEESTLLDLMFTRRYNFIFSWLPGGMGCYNPEMIEHDRMQIVNYFQDLGYADVSVDLCIEEAPRKDRIILVINVDQGPLYTIGNMSMTGNCVFDNVTVWNEFTFGRGSVFSPAEVRETTQRLSDLYGKKGYADAGIEMQFSVRPDCPIYDLQLIINEGDQYRVGLVKVMGNCTTQTRVVLHENLMCPGKIFNTKKLQGTEARLLNTGYFSSVNVYALDSSLDCNGDRYRDVFIEVEEADTGSVNLYLGFSSLEQLFGGVEINEHNFNLSGIPRIFSRGPSALRGAGEYVNAKINVGDLENDYHIQWSKPYFLDTPWILGFEANKDNNRVYSRGYTVKTFGGAAHATYISNDYLKYDIYYRARHTRITIEPGATAALRAEETRQGLLSSIGVAMIYDSTDSPRRPTSGLRSRFLTEYTGVGGEFDYLKFSYLNAYYYPLIKDTVLKFRYDFQFISTLGRSAFEEVPLSERFFLGGVTTVRGFRNYVIGPKFAPLEPKGGLSSVLLTEEIQYTLWDRPYLDLFAFVDAGMVTEQEFSIRGFAAAVGIGTRIEVMKNAPIMLGYAWPLHPTEIVNGQTISNAERFFFQMGATF